MSDLSDQSEQKNSQRNFVSDQSVFDAMVAPGVDVQLGLYLCTDMVLKRAMTQGETQECRRKMGLKRVKISPHQGQPQSSLRKE